MKIIFIVLLAIGFMYFNFILFPTKQQILNKSVISASKTIMDKYQAEFTGIGFGSNIDNLIHIVFVSFNVNKEMDIEHAREMIIFSASALLKSLNENESLKPLLLNNKLEVKKICVNFSFYDDNKQYHSHPFLRVAGINFGRLRYASKTPFSKDYEMELIESLEDAMKIEETTLSQMTLPPISIHF